LATTWLGNQIGPRSGALWQTCFGLYRLHVRRARHTPASLDLALATPSLHDGIVMVVYAARRYKIVDVGRADDGLRGWLSGERCCSGGVDSLFRHVDGEEQTWEILVLAVLRQ
jgi:hypothetical protein